MIKNDKKTWVIGIVFLVAIIGLVWFLKNRKNHNKSNSTNPILDEEPILEAESITPELIIGNDDFPLKIGSQGKKVQAVQMWLLSLGHNKIVPNGKFDSNTESVLLSVKNRNNISESYWNKIELYSFLVQD